MKAAVLLLVALVPSFALAAEPKPLNGLALVKTIAERARDRAQRVPNDGTEAQILAAHEKLKSEVDAILAPEAGKAVVFEFIVEDVLADGEIKVTLKDAESKPDPRKPAIIQKVYGRIISVVSVPQSLHGMPRAEYETIGKGNTLTIAGTLSASRIYDRQEGMILAARLYSGIDGASIFFRVASPKVTISRTVRK